MPASKAAKDTDRRIENGGKRPEYFNQKKEEDAHLKEGIKMILRNSFNLIAD